MPFPPADSSSGAQVGLAPEVERRFVDIVEDGFALHCCGDRAEPSALVASYEWEQFVDVVTIRDFERVTVVRVPERGKVDVFRRAAGGASWLGVVVRLVWGSVVVRDRRREFR